MSTNHKFVYFVFLCSIYLWCCQSGLETPERESSKQQSTPIDFDLEDIKKRGSLIAIVDNSSTGYFVYKGQPMGYEYDLLSLFAKHHQLDLEIKITTSIDEAFRMLNSGEGDLIAYSLTVTKERKTKVAFTNSHYTTHQVLVQSKPESWKNMTRHTIEKSLIRNQVNLIGKEVHVRKSSAYVDRLHNLSDEIGGDIIIIEDETNAETEEMIKKVAFGEIDYTIADESVALVNAAYFPQIDIKTPISFPQQIAWAVRKNGPDLLKSLNTWLVATKKQPTFNVIFKKYFRSPRASLIRASSDYSSIRGSNISVYDPIIKVWADSLDWDWRLLSSLVYQESTFNPYAKSWAGALGLMQLVPETGRRWGVSNFWDPEQNIAAGAKYLHYLDELWMKTIKDGTERQKFVLASYNVGLGHVEDARDLTIKYDKDPLVWDNNVEYFLLMKSRPEFFRDPIVKSGYCRGEEPVHYVRQILIRYGQYKQLIDS